MPHARQVGHECLDAGAILLFKVAGIGGRGLAIRFFDLGQRNKFVVPLPFQFIRHEAVFGSDQKELTSRHFSLLASAFDLHLAEPIDLGLASSEFLENFYGHVDRCRCHGFQQRLGYRGIQIGSWDALANGLCPGNATTLADVAGNRMTLADLVVDRHSTPTPSAEHDPLEQCGALARGTASSIGSMATGVGPQRCLVGFELLPGYVSGMSVGDKDFPLSTSQASVAGLPAHRDSALAGPSIDECTRIARVVQDVQDAAVLEAAEDHLTSSGPGDQPAGPAKIFSREMAYDLFCGSSAAEGLEERTHGTLDLLIRIENEIQ